mmetsp:Transcript_40397/g.64885  ORF Transcript_40397/g.64885 Transcript_40397/m.64885 type:complete len:181 (-) Transcript_40397:103-645(-)
MTTIGFKLGGLLFKQLVKPVAKSVKDQAATRPWLKKLCIQVGDWSNRISLRLTLRLMGHTPTMIKPLAPEKALEYGANFLGEAMVFTSGALVVSVEYTRKYFADKAKSEKKKQQEAAQKEALERRFLNLEGKVEVLLQRQREVDQTLENTRSSIRLYIDTREEALTENKANTTSWWGWNT